MTDPLLYELRQGLEQFASPALSLIQHALGGSHSSYWTQLSFNFPVNGTGLTDGTNYTPDHPLTRQLNKITLKAIRKRKTAQLHAQLSTDLVDHYALTKADAVDGAARSGAGRIFAEPLSRNFSPFPDADYIAFTRCFLSLPPRTTLNNATVQPNFDYPVQACLAIHDLHTSPFLDANGAHASSHCRSTFQNRNRKHNLIVKALASAAKEAGLEVKCEPDTYTLLLGDFSKAECRRIFPKDASLLYKQKFAELLAAIKKLSST